MRILLWGCYFRGVYVLCGPHWINAQVVTSTGFKRFKGLKVSAARITPRNKLFCLGGIFVSENFEARIFNHFKNKAPPPITCWDFHCPAKWILGIIWEFWTKKKPGSIIASNMEPLRTIWQKLWFMKGILLRIVVLDCRLGKVFFPICWAKFFPTKCEA